MFEPRMGLYFIRRKHGAPSKLADALHRPDTIQPTELDHSVLQSVVDSGTGFPELTVAWLNGAGFEGFSAAAR
jgi:hypothetical protein